MSRWFTDARLTSLLDVRPAATCCPGLSGRSVSGEVPGGSLSSRLPVSIFERGSFMACGLAGRRGEAWLKRGLPCSW